MPRSKSTPRRLTGDRRKFLNSARSFKYVSARRYARTSTSRKNIKESRIVSKVLSAVSESKILPLVERIESVPYPIQLGAQGYMWAGVLGGIPAPWATSQWNDLGSVTPVQGTGPNERVGNQYFLKRTTLQICVDAEKSLSPLPMEFRVIVARPRRSANPTGTTNDPYTSLFLNGNDVQFGPGTNTSGIPGQGTTLPQVYNSMINKRDFMVISDKYHNLCGTSIGNQQLASIRTNYVPAGCKGFFRQRFTIPHNIKAHVLPNGRISNYDASAFIMVLARTLGQDDAAGRWNIWVQGTTSYQDN